VVASPEADRRHGRQQRCPALNLTLIMIIDFYRLQHVDLLICTRATRDLHTSPVGWAAWLDFLIGS
jgi:hypothetical protein